MAALNGHVSVVKALLDQGAPIELTTKAGDTALHLAALKGHFEVCQELVNRKAPVDAINQEGKKAVDLSIDPLIMQLLAEAPNLLKRLMKQ